MNRNFSTRDLHPTSTINSTTSYSQSSLKHKHHSPSSEYLNQYSLLLSQTQRTQPSNNSQKQYRSHSTSTDSSNANISTKQPLPTITIITHSHRTHLLHSNSPSQTQAHHSHPLGLHINSIIFIPLHSPPISSITYPLDHSHILTGTTHPTLDILPELAAANSVGESAIITIIMTLIDHHPPLAPQVTPPTGLEDLLADREPCLPE